MDKNPQRKKILDKFLKVDLDENLNVLKKINIDEYNYVLIIDLINHLKYPEKFMEDMNQQGVMLVFT